jgi:hypothetical protein
MSFLSRGSGRHSKDEEEEEASDKTNLLPPTFDEL